MSLLKVTFFFNMMSKEIIILRESVQCSSELFFCVMKDNVKRVYFLL